jgi:ABC-type nitrate/sulfonate/bicarbonate transport system permease component
LIAALLSLWEIAVDLHPGQILPGPVAVANGIWELLQHGLLLN